ncbi:glycoside hydrolase family 3 [candidate division KSB3 bacterium]|uniref:beta-N-acetylhexosaminidase n=1 Tax=candidate division KSB3 bacterium TaxID=2044937 RepID=A0A2G6E994_9BACT|nr:MAG: glycoside hydrolase family 3 [candidate division KSB3 bacterium]PIE29597.1 MAG: glycoside hydrolase family 3 [candidate division KSB3 bacterium]
MTTSLERQIGQMLLVGFRGLELTTHSPIFEDLHTRHLGGVILFDYDSALKSPCRNIQSRDQLRALLQALSESASGPLLLSIDQEGGRVSRLKERFGFRPTVSARFLGERNSLELTTQYAGQTAGLLKDLGFNLNLAPVVDLHLNSASPAINAVERSFSRDPDTVIAHAGAWIREHRQQGILCALKHFPGHGSADQDTHHGFVDVSNSWLAEELIPYRALIREGLADLIMTAHIFQAGLDPKWPATLSEKIIGGLLRRELAYHGVVLSDDLQMKAISSHYSLETVIYQAINAGVDILTFGNNLTYDAQVVPKAIAIIKDLVAQKAVSEQRIGESFQRICRLKEQLSTP